MTYKMNCRRKQEQLQAVLSEYSEEALMDRLGMDREPPQTPNHLQHRFAGLIPVRPLRPATIVKHDAKKSE